MEDPVLSSHPGSTHLIPCPRIRALQCLRWRQSLKWIPSHLLRGLWVIICLVFRGFSARHSTMFLFLHSFVFSPFSFNFCSQVRGLPLCFLLKKNNCLIPLRNGPSLARRPAPLGNRGPVALEALPCWSSRCWLPPSNNRKIKPVLFLFLISFLFLFFSSSLLLFLLYPFLPSFLSSFFVYLVDMNPPGESGTSPGTGS